MLDLGRSCWAMSAYLGFWAAGRVRWERAGGSDSRQPSLSGRHGCGLIVPRGCTLPMSLVVTGIKHYHQVCVPSRGGCLPLHLCVLWVLETEERSLRNEKSSQNTDGPQGLGTLRQHQDNYGDVNRTHGRAGQWRQATELLEF